MWPKFAKILLVFTVLAGGIIAFSLLPETAKEKEAERPGALVPASAPAVTPNPEPVPAASAKSEPAPEAAPPGEGESMHAVSGPAPSGISKPAPLRGPKPAEAGPLPSFAGASPEEKKACPAGWSLRPVHHDFSAQGIMAAKPVTTHGDEALLAPEDAGLRPAVGGVIAGSNITFVIPGGTYVNIDGRHIVGVEAFTIDNKGEPGIINVIAPGLASMHKGRLTIDDKSAGAADIIYLDGCLSWGMPQRVQHDDGQAFLRYAAEDEEGNMTSVDVLEGFEVRSLPPARIRAWADAQGSP